MIARTIGRAVWLVVAFLISAGLALTVLMVLGGIWIGDELRHAYPHDPAMRAGADLFGLVIFTATVAPALTLLPALVAVVAGEVLRLRSWMYYVLAGGLSLVTVPLLAGSPRELTTMPPSQVTAIFAVAGFAGGYVYWLIAGRSV